MVSWNIRGEVEKAREIELRALVVSQAFVRDNLSNDVRGIKVAIGPDHDGDPALFIDLLVADDQHPSNDKVQRFADAISKLQLALSRETDGYFPYVNLRGAA